MSASVKPPRPDQGRHGASKWLAKLQGAQLLAQRLVLSREQSPEVLELVLRPGQPAEPRQVF
jgi:hypothetical protein